MACIATMTGSSSYATDGDTPDVSTLPFQYIDAINFSTPIATNEYMNTYIASTGLIKTYTLSGMISGGMIGGIIAVNNASAVSGTGIFVGIFFGLLNFVIFVFSGTGYTTAGQVVTTTDNQTMTLNQCAGMWLIADALASTAPVLIVSNTAVTGAPAVLTVIGTAPATDAGTYKIVKNIIPTGSVTALSGTAAAQVQNEHTHSVSGLSGSAAISEVSAATNLSGMTDTVLIFGHN